MAKRKQRKVPPPPELPESDLDSFPNDDLESQLAADIQTITGIERELSELVGSKNLAAHWLRMLTRILPGNARSAKSDRVDPLPNMSAERIQQCRQETLQHSRGHAKEAKATLQWYKENPKERREQLPPWLKTKAEALGELQVLLWRSSPEGRLATLTAGLEPLRAIVERREKKGGADAVGLRERFNACVRMTELMKQALESKDDETKARLKREMEVLEAEEAKALETMRLKRTSAGERTDKPESESLPSSPLTGRWRILSLIQAGERPIRPEGRCLIEFEGNGTGRFKFGHARGDLDGNVGVRDGKQAIEFSWEGVDASGKRWGRGYVILEGHELHGTIFFHKGGEVKLVAKRAVSVGAEKGRNRHGKGTCQVETK